MDAETHGAHSCEVLMASLQYCWKEVSVEGGSTQQLSLTIPGDERRIAKGTCLCLDFTFTLIPSQRTSGKFALFSPHTDMEGLKVS